MLTISKCQDAFWGIHDFCYLCEGQLTWTRVCWGVIVNMCIGNADPHTSSCLVLASCSSWLQLCLVKNYISPMFYMLKQSSCGWLSWLLLKTLFLQDEGFENVIFLSFPPQLNWRRTSRGHRTWCTSFSVFRLLFGQAFSWEISPRDRFCASALSESHLIVFWEVQENAR